MSVTQQQAQMLTALAVACRPTGAPQWDAAGVMAEIGKVRERSLADVILAVTRAADDRSAKTPGVISAKGSTHWQERGTRTPQREPYDRGGTCSTCSLPHAKCRQVWADDHQYVSVHEYAKTVNKDPGRIRRILESIKGEVPPMREPSKPRNAEHIARDHESCERDIAAARAAGKDGKAVWIELRCEREHQTTTTQAAQAATEIEETL
jgi:hypothetical protein